MLAGLDPQHHRARLLAICTVQVYSFGMPEPSITISLSSATPAYKQVLDQLRLLIQTGKLLPGETLPGVRTLSAQLGVHHNTVAEAYRALAAAGLLDLSHGRRATVAATTPAKLTVEQSTDLRMRLRGLVAELRSKGVPARTILNDMHAVLGTAVRRS